MGRCQLTEIKPLSDPVKKKTSWVQTTVSHCWPADESHKDNNDEWLRLLSAG
jgi:hypothetical protein